MAKDIPWQCPCGGTRRKIDGGADWFCPTCEKTSSGRKPGEPAPSLLAGEPMPQKSKPRPRLRALPPPTSTAPIPYTYRPKWMQDKYGGRA